MKLKEINIDEYTSLASTYVGVFGSKKWLSIYDKSLTIIGIYKDDHQMIGGFFYLKTKKFGAQFLKLPPYTPHCGMFFISKSKNKSSLNNFSKEVMNEVCNYFLLQKSHLTILAFPTNILDLQPFIWAKYKVVPNYTYKIDLNKSLEEITSHFDSKNRNVINKAIKEEVLISKNSVSQKEIFTFFKVHLSATGANIYESILNKIVFEFADETNSFCMVAKKNNELLGMVFCVFDNQTCYYMLGSINKQSGIQGVNNLLIQHSIENAKNLGCRVFDFEGSMLKGVEKFFRSFGPELVPYFTVNKAILPIEVLLKFKKREIF